MLKAPALVRSVMLVLACLSASSAFALELPPAAPNRPSVRLTTRDTEAVRQIRNVRQLNIFTKGLLGSAARSYVNAWDIFYDVSPVTSIRAVNACLRTTFSTQGVDVNECLAGVAGMDPEALGYFQNAVYLERVASAMNVACARAGWRPCPTRQGNNQYLGAMINLIREGGQGINQPVSPALEAAPPSAPPAAAPVVATLPAAPAVTPPTPPRRERRPRPRRERRPRPAPAPAPVETSVQAPVEAPVEAPAPVEASAPVEVPTQAETPAPTPAENPAPTQPVADAGAPPVADAGTLGGTGTTPAGTPGGVDGGIAGGTPGGEALDCATRAEEYRAGIRSGNSASRRLNAIKFFFCDVTTVYSGNPYAVTMVTSLVRILSFSSSDIGGSMFAFGGGQQKCDQMRETLSLILQDGESLAGEMPELTALRNDLLEAQRMTEHPPVLDGVEMSMMTGCSSLAGAVMQANNPDNADGVRFIGRLRSDFCRLKNAIHQIDGSMRAYPDSALIDCRGGY